MLQILGWAQHKQLLLLARTGLQVCLGRLWHAAPTSVKMRAAREACAEQSQELVAAEKVSWPVQQSNQTRFHKHPCNCTSLQAWPQHLFAFSFACGSLQIVCSAGILRITNWSTWGCCRVQMLCHVRSHVHADVLLSLGALHA